MVSGNKTPIALSKQRGGSGQDAVLGFQGDFNELFREESEPDCSMHLFHHNY